MILETVKEHETFLTLLEGRYSEINKETPFGKLRAKAWDLFTKKGLPHKKTAGYSRVPIRKFFETTPSFVKENHVTLEALSPHILPECQDSFLVTVNGSFVPELSCFQEGIVLPLEDAMKSYGTYLNKRWSESLKKEQDPLALLNCALHVGGLFIYIPPKKIVKKPLQILHFVTKSSQMQLLMPRIECFVGAFAEFSLVSTLVKEEECSYWMNSSLDFSLEEGAKVSHIQAQESTETEENIVVESICSTQKKQAIFKNINVCKGSLASRYDYQAFLTGTDCEVELNALWTLSKKAQIHHQVLIYHEAPHCRSMQLFKGVLDDFSHSSFEGKIYVCQEAQKTDAFQLNNNLVLSDKARADSQPNLEIFADDVKASHGATTGQLNRDELFYLMARGLSRAQAKKILIFAYCHEILGKVFIQSLKDRLIHDLECN